MKILVTNDDGIQAEGIRLLAEWAKKLGDVTVCAPKTQQSAKSHAITVHNPIEIREVRLMDGVEAYAVDSTPVDCVRYATLGLNRKYDLILSGVNNGFNIGEDILYSGTVAAIFEAALRDTCGIAFSTEWENFEPARAHIDEVYEYFMRNELFAYNKIYNVNFPSAKYKGIQLCRQGGAYFTDEFVKTADGLFDQQGYSVYEYGTNLELDTDATMNGYVSIMPLSVKRDDAQAFEKLKRLNK